MNIQIYDNFEQISDKTVDEIRKFDTEKISDYFYDPFTFVSGIVSNDDRVLAAAVIRVINEFKVVLRPDTHNYIKAKILRDLIKYGVDHMQCNEIIISITQGGEHYQKILEKHFGFYKDNGIVLRKEL